MAISCDRASNHFGNSELVTFQNNFCIDVFIINIFLFLQQSPTDDYSNLQDSTDDSKVSETMTRGKMHLTD